MKKVLIVWNLVLLMSSSVFAAKYHPGHWLSLQRGATNSDLNKVTNPGIVGIQKRYTWKALEPTMDNYDFSAIQADLNYVKARGGHLLAFIEEKSFNSEIITPDYLTVGVYTLQFSAKADGYVSKRWDPFVVERVNALTAALAATFDNQDNFEGICFQESAIGVKEPALSNVHGYTPALYRDALISMISSAKASFVNSQVMWYFNFLSGNNNYIKHVGDAVAPLGAMLGGPDIMPDSYSLNQHVYPQYDYFLPKGYQLFCSAQFESYEHYHAGTSVYWTPLEIFEWGRDNLGIKYLFWNNKTWNSPPGSYNVNDAYPVIAANPVFNQPDAGGGTLYENDFSTGSVTDDFIGQTQADLDGWSISGGKLVPTAQWKTVSLGVTGAATLTDYTLEVDLKTLTPGTTDSRVAGAIVRYQDDTHYYWVFIDKNGTLKVQKRDGTVWTYLAESPEAAFAPMAGVNFNLKIVVAGDNITTIDVFVNGEATPSAIAVDYASTYLQGPPAFESRGTTAIEMDNLKVSYPHLYKNDFESSFQFDFSADSGQVSDWNIDNGQLQRVGGWKRIYLTASDAASWTDYTVDADYQNVTVGANASNVGILTFRYVNGECYGVYVDKNGNLALGKRLSGSWNFGLQTKGGFIWNAAYSFTIEAIGDNIKVYVDGNSIPDLDYTDTGTTLTTGGLGFEVRGNHTKFDNLFVTEGVGAIEVNHPPFITSIADQSMDENNTLTISIASSDPDPNDTLTLSADGLPAFSSLADNGDGSGSITFDPVSGDAGTYVITVTVDDGNETGNTADMTFSLSVNVEPVPVSYYNDFSTDNLADDFIGDTDYFSIGGGQLLNNTCDVWKTITLKDIHFPIDANNFKIVSKMKRDPGVAWGGAAIRFRDSGAANWYELQIQTDSGDDLRLYGQESGSSVTPGTWNVNLDSSVYNVYSVVVSDGNASVYLGNQFVGSATLANLTGTVGLRQRKDDARWDYFRVVSMNLPDYRENFDDAIAQDWVYDSEKFELKDIGNGNVVLKQANGSWSFATYNTVVSVDANYRLSLDARVSGTRTAAFDSPAMVLKYVDSSNWINIYIEQDLNTGARSLVLKKKIGGVASTATVATGITELGSVTDWHRLQAQVTSSILKVWINDVEVVAAYFEADLTASFLTKQRNAVFALIQKELMRNSITLCFSTNMNRE